MANSGPNTKVNQRKRQATTTAKSAIRIVIHGLTIVFIQVGIFAWWQMANWDYKYWVDRYYVWDKIVNFLLVLCILHPTKTLIPFWILIGIFFVIRCLIEIALISKSMEQVAHFLTEYHAMFLINIICIAAVFITQKGKCRKLNL